MSRINMSKAHGISAANSFGLNFFLQRVFACCAAIGVALSIGNIAPRAFAVDFTWNGAVSGNWTTAASWNVGVGHPDDADDSATINATGDDPYTATLNASKTIGEFHIASADATLTTGVNVLTIDGNAATTTNPGQFTHTGGVLNGNYRFIKANVSLSNVTSTAATVFEFRQFSACCGVQNNSIEFGAGGQIKANQTLKATAFDSLGIISLATTGNVQNLGAIDITTAGYTGGTNNNHIIWALAGGTLTNQNLATFASTRATDSSLVQINANVLNDTGATMNVSTPSSGQVQFIRVGGIHENRGSFNVTGAGGGLLISGNGTSFTQNTSGASINASRFTFGNQANTIQNTFSATAGTISGLYVLGQTALTLGSGATTSGPTTFKFEGETLNTFTGDVVSNATILLRTVGSSEGAFLTTPGSLANNGTITLEGVEGYVPNNAVANLTVAGGSGTITNNGTINATSIPGNTYSGEARINANVVNHGTTNFGVIDNSAVHTAITYFDGNLTNETAGTVNVAITGSAVGASQVQFLDGPGGTYINRGSFNLNSGPLNLTGGTLNNQSTGTFAGQGTLQGTLLSSGTVGPGIGANDAGILNVNGAVNFAAGGKLTIDVLTGGAVAGTDYDRLAVTGSVTGLSNATLIVNINELLGTGDFTGDTLTILTTTTGNLSNQTFGSVQFLGGFSADVTYLTNSIVLSNFVQVPEPGTGLMLLLGLAGCSRLNRRRKSV